MHKAITSSTAAVTLLISAQILAQEIILEDGFDDRLACEPASGGGSAVASMPVLDATLFDLSHESWLGSPAVADLDGDKTPEVIAARHDRVLGWHTDGNQVFSAETGVRIWASPIIADLDTSTASLEVAAASGDKVYVWDADAELITGFPVTWQGELRSLAAGDIDGNGDLELVVVSTQTAETSGEKDVVIAYHHDGSVVGGFPPNATASSGCDEFCFIVPGYDQNIALGNVDGDAALELLASQDNSSLSLHKGSGLAFDSNEIFQIPTKFPGIRFLHDYAEAQQGYSLDEENSLQSQFTRTAPVVADVDGDGEGELVFLGSVQNVSQTNRELGAALWIVETDGTRLPDWIEPFYAPDYLAGLYDFAGTNIVGISNQLAAAEINSYRAGPEFVFAGFDGKIHAVDSAANELWQYTYTTDPRVLTSGVVIGDLSGDGNPEVVFATYSPDDDKSDLIVLGADGGLQRSVSLPDRGAMAVPTLADADDDGTLDIVVNLKDAETGVRQVQIYEVPGSSDNCLLWPTGRGNLLRNGYLAPG